MGVEISIIVPSRGRADKLSRLLSDLERQRCGESFEVIVALDGGTAGDAASGLSDSRFPVEFIELPRVGISAAKNAAVAEARGRILLFVNDDIEPGPEFVRQHALAHAAGHRIVLGATPWKRFDDQTLFDEAVAQTRMIFFYGRLRAGTAADFRHAWNLNLSIERSLLSNQPGPFAEGLRPYMYEDLELAYRLMGRERKVVHHPAAMAVHNHRFDLAGYMEREAILGVMASQLYAVNPDCAAALFGCGLDELRNRGRRGLTIDTTDAGRSLSALVELAARPRIEESDSEDVRLFYLAHLPLKRRAFRVGLLADAEDPHTPWTERPGFAVRALRRDSVFGQLPLRSPHSCHENSSLQKAAAL